MAGRRAADRLGDPRRARQARPGRRGCAPQDRRRGVGGGQGLSDQGRIRSGGAGRRYGPARRSTSEYVSLGVRTPRGSISEAAAELAATCDAAVVVIGSASIGRSGGLRSRQPRPARRPECPGRGGAGRQSPHGRGPDQRRALRPALDRPCPGGDRGLDGRRGGAGRGRPDHPGRGLAAQESCRLPSQRGWRTAPPSDSIPAARRSATARACASAIGISTPAPSRRCSRSASVSPTPGSNTPTSMRRRWCGPANRLR